MTPLAQDFTNDLLRPRAERRWEDGIGLGFGVREFHFFEVSAVFEAAVDLVMAFQKRGIPRATAFLPADATWIECKYPSGSRKAFLLRRHGDHASLSIALQRANGDAPFFTRPVCWLPLNDSEQDLDHFNLPGVMKKNAEIQDVAIRHGYMALAFLAMINTPRVIGRLQHMPHRGLERKLVAQRGLVGKFPLRAWTEIVLEVTPPRIDDSEPREAHFTGAKALHFVRCHLRLVGGALVLVSPHWRGDPALGIKQTRYRLKPPHRRAA